MTIKVDTSGFNAEKWGLYTDEQESPGITRKSETAAKKINAELSRLLSQNLERPAVEGAMHIFMHDYADVGATDTPAEDFLSLTLDNAYQSIWGATRYVSVTRTDLSKEQPRKVA